MPDSPFAASFLNGFDAAAGFVAFGLVLAAAVLGLIAVVDAARHVRRQIALRKRSRGAPMTAAATVQQAREQLRDFNAALSTAYLLLKPFTPLIEQFQRESQIMDSIGPLLAPHLFMDPERRACEQMLKPLYEQARQFLQTYEIARDAAEGAAIRQHKESRK